MEYPSTIAFYPRETYTLFDGDLMAAWFLMAYSVLTEFCLLGYNDT
jgi:hypothetical protein